MKSNEHLEQVRRITGHKVKDSEAEAILHLAEQEVGPIAALGAHARKKALRNAWMDLCALQEHALQTGDTLQAFAYQELRNIERALSIPLGMLQQIHRTRRAAPERDAAHRN